jgi:hypothetical protein
MDYVLKDPTAQYLISHENPAPFSVGVANSRFAGIFSAQNTTKDRFFLRFQIFENLVS